MTRWGRLLLSVVLAGAMGAAAAPAAAALAAGDLHRAPLSAAYRQYRRDAAETAAREAASRFGGLVPSPVDIARLSALGTSARLRATATGLPSSYDLRDASPARLSPVEDQGTYGTCWAFAALGSLESCLWSADSSDTFVFSEDNLVLGSGYYSSRSTTGRYNAGGNSLMAAAYLAAWKGPVDADLDAYGDGVTPSGLTAARHVQDVLYLPGRTSAADNDAIKAAVVDDGAVYTSLYYSSSGGYYNSTTHAYYYDGSASDDAANHAVAIVGWDDDYAASNFTKTPAGNGAFIVRNSWGSSWGDGGYFYLSYHDAVAGRAAVTDGSGADGNAVFVAPESSTDYAREYRYDPLGWTSSLGTGSTTGWFASRFTASADEDLAAVAFYAATAGSSYVVCEGPTTSSLTEVASGTLTYAGYHTVTLTSRPSLTSGDRFVVAVRLTTPGCDYPIPIEYPISGYSDAAGASGGHSYVSADGSDWEDLTAISGFGETDVCLNAFTAGDEGSTDTKAPVATVSGEDSSWHRRAVTLKFGASDGSGGSGVAAIQYSMDGAGWQTGDSVRVAAPADHSNDGRHTVSYRAFDKSGNVAVARSCAVKIDTRKPSAAAPSSAAVRRGDAATLKFRLTDRSPCAGTCRVVIRVRTLAGVLKKTLRPTTWYASDGSLHGYRYTCRLPRGRYCFSVAAVDRAGNSGTASTNLLVVR